MPLVMNNRGAALGLSLGKGEGRLVLRPGLNDVDAKMLDAVENQEYLGALFDEALPALRGRCALELQGEKPKGKGKKKKPDAE